MGMFIDPTPSLPKFAKRLIEISQLPMRIWEGARKDGRGRDLCPGFAYRKYKEHE